MIKKAFNVLPLSIGLLMAGGPAFLLAEEKHWTYSGAEGPEYWGDLNPTYSTCMTGKNQSPVNITKPIATKLPEVQFNYQAGGQEILNNGHTIQVKYAPGSTLTVNAQTYELKQFHFHAPSENLIENQSYPLEAHFVHAGKDGNLAVVAVMYEEGKENTELAKAWAKMPQQAGVTQPLTEPVNANLLIPHERGYYLFTGSLTTPPCTEGVLWLVIKNDFTVSKAQIDAFTHIMHHPNNRPVQPLNTRRVIQ